MSKPKEDGAGNEPRRGDVRAYEARWGGLPSWLRELSAAHRARVVQVAVRLGMRLSETDWHLLEDQERPDLLPVKRRPPATSAGG